MRIKDIIKPINEEVMPEIEYGDSFNHSEVRKHQDTANRAWDRMTDVDEASLDPSGLLAAASMVKDYIVTAEVDGKVKRFKVRGMTGERSAKERFLRHAAYAKVLKVEPVAC